MASEFDKKLERYKKFIPEMYRPGTNPFVTALIGAFAQGDSNIELQLIEAGKQLFIPTAEGKYLDSLGANVGVDRPLSINMSDDKFRDLIPTLSFKPKQIRKTMYDILDVFWGPLYSRANITSLAAEPYNLGIVQNLSGSMVFQNDSLSVTGVGTTFTIELKVGDYVKFVSHGNLYFAKVSRIISNTSLLLSEAYKGGGKNQVVTGQGQKYTPLSLTLSVDNSSSKTIIIPPNNIIDTQAVTAQEVVNAINSQTSTNSSFETITASVIEDFVRDQSFVNIRTNTPGSIGSLKITGGTANHFAYGVQNSYLSNFYVSSEQSLEFLTGQNVIVGSTIGSIQTTINNKFTNDPILGVDRITLDDDVSTYLLADDCYIYKKGDLGFTDKEVVITQLKQQTIIYEINTKELIVRIPATVPALRRSLKGSMHLRDGWSGEIISIDNLAKTVTVNLDSQEALTIDFHALRKFSVQFNEFDIISHTSGINGVVIQFALTEDLSVLSTTPGENGFVVLDDKYIGSFIYDERNTPFTVTRLRCILNQTISKGSVYPSINVTGSDDIPNDVGSLIINFGRSGQEQPIRYRGRPNNNTLLLDPAYIFKNTHIAGEIINVLVSTLRPTKPRITGEDYATYVTGIREARLVVQNLINDTKAAGVTLKFIIDFPEYLWVTGRPTEND